MANNLPAKTHNVTKIGEELARANDRFTELLPRTLPTARFVGLVKSTLNSNPELRECTPKSIVSACEKAASDGLLLDGREAALVIFNKRGKLDDGSWGVVAREAQYIPMVAGMRRRIYNSGLVSVLETGIVFEGELKEGLFEYQAGTDPRLIHRTMIVGDRGEPVAAYSVVTMATGFKSIEVMRWDEIMRIAKLQSKNVAFKDDDRKGVRKGDLVGVWAEHTHEMARKTVLRRHAKQLPFDSDTARMFERVDGLYRPEGEEIDHDADEAAANEAPAAGRKREGAGRAALNKARQEREASNSTPSEPERQDDVEDAEVVDSGGDETDEDRI